MHAYASRESFGSVESVKAASDVYAPAAGEVVEVNEVSRVSPPTFVSCFLVCLFNVW